MCYLVVSALFRVSRRKTVDSQGYKNSGDIFSGSTCVFLSTSCLLCGGVRGRY